MTELIDFQINDGVARLTFNNPRRLNAINAEMWRALPSLLARASDDPAVRVLVLGGAGERAFCTGNDVSEFETVRADPAAVERYNALQRKVAEDLHKLKKPVLAAVHGYCLGAGFELALMSDLRIVSADTRVGVPAVKLGLPYRLEDIVKLADVVGLMHAREMVLLGRQYTGDELLRLGVANVLVPHRDDLPGAVEAMTRELLENAPLSLAAAKVAFAALTAPRELANEAEAKAWADRCYASRDYAEGRAAKRGKRRPVFTGE